MRRFFRLVLPLPLLGSMLLGVRDSTAMGGTEGTFEFAIDAPWRIEPVFDAAGHVSYGAIPINITLLDENVIVYDSFISGSQSARTPPGYIPTQRQIGQFCEVDVLQNGVMSRFLTRDLAELELTRGSWIQGQPAPPHFTCRPSSDPLQCELLRRAKGTSEWNAMFWFVPRGFTPGVDVMLTISAKFARATDSPCTSTNADDYLVLTNYVAVHAGEAPLPRFKDNRWAYGDLHYHGQGTDNEGESGYNYRAVVRAMGAMGLDFVLATEHASDSDQILDIDFNGYVGGAFKSEAFAQNGRALRDMNATRFAFLLNQLREKGGVNDSTAIEASTQARTGLPQNVRGHGAAPQIFLGGEVDVMVELPRAFPSTGSFTFGNKVSFALSNLCGGWVTMEGASPCPQDQTVQQDLGVTILRDDQGFNSMYPSRAHMIYFPRDAANASGFVASHTDTYGGAQRHLSATSSSTKGVLPEIEAKGYTFLAHPIPAGACDGGTPGLAGDQAPDVVPYTPRMLDQAFGSPAVLGLQFWNEDIRMKNHFGRFKNAVNNFGRSVDGSDARELGYESGQGGYGFRSDEPDGFRKGAFGVWPWQRFPEVGFAETCQSMEWTLHHGAKQWDDLVLRGLQTWQTNGLSWLAAGEPRRLFMAGGSDAHGDLNYHRAGYVIGLQQTDDMAIGKPRNLVFAGAPETKIPFGTAATKGGITTASAATDHGLGNVVLTNADVDAFSHRQILDGLVKGNFSVTDGPAVRIAVDRNGNRKIDDGDIPMGGVVELYGEGSLPLIVEWDSTPEWGVVEIVDIVVVAASSKEPTLTALFAPTGHGPRTTGTPSTAVLRTRSGGLGHTLTERQDGYTDDPTSEHRLRFTPGTLSGSRTIFLPLRELSIGQSDRGGAILPDRLAVRAVVRAMQKNGAKCVPDPKGKQCIPRYAFANPVWAITPAPGTCPKGRPRAIDSDGDGIPDGCDPCTPDARGLCVPKGSGTITTGQ